MTIWIYLQTLVCLVFLCGECVGKRDRYHEELWNLNAHEKKSTDDVASILKSNHYDVDSDFHFPKFRRFRPKRMQMFEDEVFPYMSEEKKNISRRSEEYIFPSFHQSIENVTVPLGREAKLVCIVDNLGHHRVAWLRLETKTILTIHRHVISRNYRITLSHSEHRIWILHIDDVQEVDAGGYMCQVNTVPMLSQVGYLDVVVPPDIKDTESSSDVIAREGTDVSMTCKAKGKPKPTLSWRREDNLPVAIGNWQAKHKVSKVINDTEKPTKKTLHHGETLTIKKVSRLHMGAYLCIASNGVPPAVSRRILLQVNFPPMMWIPNQLVGAPLGSNVTIDCHTEAHPESINYWTKDEGTPIQDGNKYKVVNDISSYKVHMMLTVKNLGHSDYGTYMCFARNSLGTTEGSIRIYEIHVPQLVKEPSTAKIQSVDGTSGIGSTPRPDDSYWDDKTETSSQMMNLSVDDPVKEESTSSSTHEGFYLVVIIAVSCLFNTWVVLFGT